MCRNIACYLQSSDSCYWVVLEVRFLDFDEQLTSDQTCFTEECRGDWEQHLHLLAAGKIHMGTRQNVVIHFGLPSEEMLLLSTRFLPLFPCIVLGIPKRCGMCHPS